MSSGGSTMTLYRTHMCPNTTQTPSDCQGCSTTAANTTVRSISTEKRIRLSAGEGEPLTLDVGRYKATSGPRRPKPSFVRVPRVTREQSGTGAFNCAEGRQPGQVPVARPSPPGQRLITMNSRCPHRDQRKVEVQVFVRGQLQGVAPRRRPANGTCGIPARRAQQAN
jgi:hypothetical protein